MSIRLCWDRTDNTILHQVFEEGWTLQAYYHSIEAIEAMVSSRQHPVRLIMDLSAASTPPVRMARGRSVNEAKATRNIEHVILVKPGYFMPILDCPVDIVDTYDEAHMLLAQNEPMRLPA